MVKVLLIDDDKELHTVLKIQLPNDYTLISAYTGSEGEEFAASEHPEIIFLNSSLPDCSGLDLLKKILSDPFPPPVIMISDETDISVIVKAVRIGASNYIQKPLEIKVLKTAVLQALLEIGRQETSTDIPEESPLQNIIGVSKEMVNLKRLVKKYGSTEEPVLITGESGTGKEIVAKTIHELSKRDSSPFVPVNCGAIPETLMQSELFGAEKGAYTGATTARKGKFEQANLGTLFLDEIGEMDIAVQVQLLRIIENQNVYRLGSTRAVPVNVRIVTATNKNLRKAIKNEKFRMDLFYRINTLTIDIPPLRKRKIDIPHLARHFISASGTPDKILSIGAIQKLADYSWPGNVRELKATIARSMVLADDNKICPEHIRFDPHL